MLSVITDGNYYRNKIGILVLIVGFIDPGCKEWELGYRYFDHRGTYYTASGSVQSRMWGSLDLASEVNDDDVTEEEADRIVRQWNRFVKFELAKMNVRNAFSSTWSFTKKFGIGFIGAGAASLGILNSLDSALRQR